MRPRSATESSPRLTGLPAAIRDGARLLVLGSMPGAESLRLQQYYAHPRNEFWRIVEDLLAIPRTLDYGARITALNQRGVAVWDVLADCVRPGSLDASIDVTTARANDIAALLRAHSGIDAIVLNGGFAEKTFRRRIATDGALSPHVRVVAVPSTSPANASIPYATKLARWHDAFRPTIELLA